MDSTTRIFDQSLFTVVPLVCGTAICLVLAFIYKDHAVGTSARPDLFSPPYTLPFIGHLRWILNVDRQLEQFHFANAEKRARDDARAITITLPYLRFIDITDPHNLKHIQKTNASNYIKGPFFEKNLADLLGGGIFVVDHEPWKIARKATSKIFTGALFRSVISSSIDTDLTKMRILLRHHAKTGETLDLSALFYAFTLSTFSRMAFSVELETLRETEIVEVPFARAVDFAQFQMTYRFSNPLWPLFERFTAAGRKMKKSVKIIDDFAYGIIDEREIMGLGSLEKAAAGKQDLISLYMALRDESGQPLSRKALRDAVLNLIIAGRDSTSQAISWLFFHLISNPSLLVPVRVEVDKTPVVDYDSYKLMIQSIAAFHEGLRLHPTVPTNFHQSVADDILPSGTVIKAGDICRWSDWEMGRSTEIWGPRAGTFDPSRWIDAQGSLIHESQYKFHAFNGGARTCLGQQLATFEAVSVLATIVRDFDITVAPEFEGTEMIDVGDAIRTPRFQNSLSLPMKSPLFVKVALRTT